MGEQQPGQQQGQQQGQGKPKQIIGWWIRLYLIGILICALLTTFFLYSVVEKYTDSSQNALKQHLYSSRKINIISSIDSCGTIKPYDIVPMSPETHKIIIDQSIAKLTEHNQTMAETAKDMMNIIVMWGSILTLMSVIFTFLGYLEVRTKVRDIEQQKNKLEEFITQKQKEFDKEVEELKDFTTEMQNDFNNHVRELRESTNEERRKFTEQTLRLEDFITKKQEEFDEHDLKVEETMASSIQTEQLHKFYIYMFDSLHRSRYTSDQIDMIKKLINNIENDQIIKDEVMKEEKKMLLAKCHYYLGRMYDDLPYFKDAIDNYSKSIEYFNGDGFVYYNRAINYLEDGNIVEAFEDINRSLSINKHDMVALYRLGTIYAIQDKVEKAITAFVSAEKVAPPIDTSVKSPTKLNELIDDKLIVQLRQESPTKANIFLIRGYMFEQMGKYTDACKDYSSALEIAKNNETLKEVIIQRIETVKSKVEDEKLDEKQDEN